VSFGFATIGRGGGWLALGIAVAALGLLAYGAPPRAAASEVADASCAGPPQSFETNIGTSRYAQTFTAQNSGTLTSAQLEVYKDHTSTTGDWVVDLLDTSAGIPVDGVLATVTVPDTTVPELGSLITANFATPASVVAGHLYALEFSRPASTMTGVGERNADACPGQLFSAAAAPGTFSAAGETGMDMVFSITVNAVEHLLTVNKAGTGAGIVTGTGLDCGSDCTESYNNGTSVILTATASSGSSFGGWAGCDTPVGNSCTMSLDADKTVTAAFIANPTPPLTTGLRTKALKKCKKKRSKAKRRKCQKKARKLPL
jgi:hypothetical protein